jgi:hypothetical protein
MKFPLALPFPFFRVKYLLTCLFCALSFNSNAQSWNWAKGEGDIGNDASNSITLDDNGNAYITGNIAGKADFSGMVYQGRGVYEVFIAKYDPQGNLLWVKTAGGSDNDQGNAIKYRNNFIYLTGFFSDTAWFETTMLISKGDADAFTAKYDLSGNLIWVKQAGGSGFDYGSSIDIDNGGNVFIGGTYETSLALDTVHLSSSNLYNESFFAKYDSNGNLVWAKSSVGNNANLITGLAFNNHNSIFLTGYFGGNFKIGNGTVNSATASYDIFLAKVDEAGNLQWMKRAGSNYEDAAHSVCSDKDGNPSITGYFAGTAFFGTNSVTYLDYNDIFVARYDSSGNNLWVRAGRGNKLDVGFSITADDNGNVFATGMFQNTTNFDGHILTASDILDRDIFLVSYDKSGNIRWITSPGGLDTDCGLGVAVSHSGVVAISGYYLYSCYFGSVRLDDAQANDLFIAEYSPPIVNAIEEPLPDSDFSIYPNPCSSHLGIVLKSPSASVIKVYDVNGHQLSLTRSADAGIEINTLGYADGMYLLSVENKGITTWKKFTVAN